jgi:hypothetical protein
LHADPQWADPRRSGCATPLQHVVSALAWHLRVRTMDDGNLTGTATVALGPSSMPAGSKWGVRVRR